MVQKYLPQTSVRIGCDCLHLTFLGRFVYDVLYFGQEVRAIMESLGLWDFVPAGDTGLQASQHPTTVEVAPFACLLAPCSLTVSSSAKVYALL